MTPISGKSRVKPQGRRALKVLYLYAGLRLRAELAACLKTIISEFNACADFDFCFRAFGLSAD